MSSLFALLQGLDQTSSGRKFAPFGGGLRLCPGSELGKVEAAFFLHHLVLQYGWRLDGEYVPMAHLLANLLLAYVNTSRKDDAEKISCCDIVATTGAGVVRLICSTVETCSGRRRVSPVSVI